MISPTTVVVTVILILLNAGLRHFEKAAPADKNITIVEKSSTPQQRIEETFRSLPGK